MKKLIFIQAMLCALFCCISVYAQEKNPLEQQIELNLKKGSISTIIKELQKIEGINFSYNAKSIPDKEVQLTGSKLTLKEWLDQVFKGTDLTYRIMGDQIILYTSKPRSKATLNGKIKSIEDGEYLPGATIYIPELKTGVITNAYGFYSITLPAGVYTVNVSFVGFQTLVQTVDLSANQTLDMELEEDVQHLSEVVVNGEQENENIINTETSSHTMQLEKIKSMPALGGEADVLKGIQFLPGIQSANQGTTGFSVRGGSYDQNLILLDEATVFNPSHSVGLFSIFNPDVIKDIKVYKGGIPARYGGRLSSVVDIKMREGNDKKLSVTGSAGVVSSRLTVETPIGDKASVLVSGRYGYIGETAKSLARLAGVEDFDQNSEISFYDLNAKMNFKLSDKDRLYISTYIGDDHFKNDVVFADNTLDWSNKTATVRWNRSFGSKLFGNLTLVRSEFDYAYKENRDIRNYQWDANFKQSGAKLDFDYFLSPKHELHFGLDVKDHDFSPGRISPLNDESIIEQAELDSKNAIESSIYFSHDFRISPKLSVYYGLRATSFLNIGSGTKYFYADNQETVINTEEFSSGEIMNSEVGLEPRASLNYLLNNNNSIKLSYNRTFQFLHLVSNSSVGLPTDVWLPVDNNVKPRRADQIAIGYFQNFKDNTLKFSTEAYYKSMDNVIDYRDNAELFLNNNIETQIRTGKGEAYGLEFMLEKPKGRLTGWTSYTLSSITHKIDGINRNRTYSPRYDRRHNLSMVLNYELTKKWHFAANYSYISGGGITVPLGFYNTVGRPYNYYSDRNAYRLPAFHQLDFSAIRKFGINRKWKHEVALGVTNAYNRRNVFSLFVDHQENARSKVSKLFLFGAMPTLTYNFKF